MNETPIPSHFSKSWTMGTMGAINNKKIADHKSASRANVNNCTAQVFYQDLAYKLLSKPPVSSTNLKTRQVCLKQRLSCQELKTVYKPAIRPSLPPSFKTIEDVDGFDVDKNSSA